MRCDDGIGAGISQAMALAGLVGEADDWQAGMWPAWTSLGTESPTNAAACGGSRAG